MQEATISTGVMIEKLSGLLGTNDLNEWQAQFVRNLKGYADAGQVTRLSAKQLKILTDLHRKHFG